MFPNLNFLRKPACDFGWDWGPAFASSGLLGQVQLLGTDTSYLTGGRHPYCPLLLQLIITHPDSNVFTLTAVPGFTSKRCCNAGCNVRQQHSPDGVVELFIDTMLHCPTGCASHSVSLLAELQVGEGEGMEKVRCTATAYVDGEGEVIVPLQVSPLAAQLYHWDRGSRPRCNHSIIIGSSKLMNHQYCHHTLPLKPFVKVRELEYIFK